MITDQNKLRRKITILIWIFIIGLLASGITAFPLEWELSILSQWSGYLSQDNPLRTWIIRVYEALHTTNYHYPFIAYGTDWLAFAHIVIAIAFIGPLRDPVRNVWIIHFGIISCLLVFPLALIAGQVRGIPFYWRLIDCSFGAIGIIPLIVCNSYIKKLSILLNQPKP